MQRVLVSVRRSSDAFEADFELPTDVAAAELAEKLGPALGLEVNGQPLQLRAPSLGRALRPHETLAEAGLWTGAELVLARVSDPLDPELTTARRELAVIDAWSERGLVHQPPPPTLALPPVDPPTRPIVPLVAAALALLALAAVGGWFLHRQQSTPPVALEAAGPAIVEPTAVPSVAATPVVALPISTAQPTLATAASPDEASAWRELAPRLDIVWGDDWPAAISMLQNFHNQYPTQTTATEKLYAAFVEYGRALRDAGATSAAAEQFDQAVRLAPQRIEARAELAALATPTPTEAPQTSPTPLPTSVPVPALARAPLAAPPPPAPTPVEARPGCDVTSLDRACPLADGSRVQDTIDVPNGRNYYWFGVPVANMQLHVDVSGPACPCTLFILSDAVDNAMTPLATAYATDGSPTTLEYVLTDTGPYVLELAPVQNGTSASNAVYQLGFTLRVPAPSPPPADDVSPGAAPAPPLQSQPVSAPAPAPVAVPPVVGRAASDAADRIRGAGLVPRTESANLFSAGGPGTVAAQDPAAGATLQPGGRVRLLIASGNVVVPSVLGASESDAVSRLREAGLDMDIRHVRRSGAPTGTVADISPGPGEVVPAGTKVAVTISQGP